MKIGTTLMKWLVRALGALPLGFHYACSGFFTWILKDVMRYRRDVVMANLSRSFPEKKYSELESLSDGFYRHFGRLLAETVWFGGCRNPERLRRQHLVEFSNLEVCEAAYENSPGVVLLNSHFGNWELTGGFLSYDYRPEAERKVLFSMEDMAVVYKPLKSRMWDEIMCDNRCAPILRDGFKGYVPTEKVLRFAVGHGDRKMLYVFPTDQCPYKGAASNDTVDFMHQPTKTMLGGASIAHKFGYSVLYMSIAPVSKGCYEWGFTEICRDASKMTPHEIMQRYYELLQADIEKYPTGYLWSHKRWKR
ncbi:MAG: lysophospholipid acyltransferase family protein [Bacteroidales bacterium]|nr:lysophospholipid acyltransferase family protein [Bacteroidales bacterium]